MPRWRAWSRSSGTAPWRTAGWWSTAANAESGADGSQTPRGQLWVRRDGTVLRQQVCLFDAAITFDRLPDSEAEELAKAAGRQWWIMEYEQQGKKHD